TNCTQGAGRGKAGAEPAHQCRVLHRARASGAGAQAQDVREHFRLWSRGGVVRPRHRTARRGPPHSAAVGIYRPARLDGELDLQFSRRGGSRTLRAPAGPCLYLLESSDLLVIFGSISVSIMRVTGGTSIEA